MKVALLHLALVAWLLACTASFGQTVPSIDGILLDEPLPTRFTSGETYWVSGTVQEGISGVLFEFSGNGETLEHRAVVVGDRLRHPLVFQHADAGEYTLHIVFFPKDGESFFTEVRGVEVIEGVGEIDRPWEYYDSLVGGAYFRPNVIRTDALELPPLFVSTSGRVETVIALVPDGIGGESERMLLDDGLAGDERAGDGIYTMTGEAYHPHDFDLETYGMVVVKVAYTEVGGRVHRWRAECGLVEEVVELEKMADDVYRSDHVVNLVDDGTLFVLSRPFVDMRTIARRFYRYFSDDYDFLVVRSALPLSNNLHGQNFNVRNDISGIGLSKFDYTEEFGSAGRLQSATFINLRLNGPLIHEVAHNWANYIDGFGGEFWGGHWGLSDVRGCWEVMPRQSFRWETKSFPSRETLRTPTGTAHIQCSNST